MGTKDLLEEVGLNPEDTKAWASKYHGHRSHTTERGLQSHITPLIFFTKVVEAGLTKPDQIGRRRGQHVLGRVGDVGDYISDTCRFISVEQNNQERIANGGMAAGAKKRTGRTKESHPGLAAMADKKSKDYIVTDPNGNIFDVHNLNAFCKDNDLHKGHLYNVCNGKIKHHKGWGCKCK